MCRTSRIYVYGHLDRHKWCIDSRKLDVQLWYGICKMAKMGCSGGLQMAPVAPVHSSASFWLVDNSCDVITTWIYNGSDWWNVWWPTLNVWLPTLNVWLLRVTHFVVGDYIIRCSPSKRQLTYYSWSKGTCRVVLFRRIWNIWEFR
jgi:hypothetical protein